MSVGEVETEERTIPNSALWVDRTAEARELADFILAADEGLVVLYGRYAVGKTTLIKRYVMPLLPDDYEIRFDDASHAFGQGIDVEAGRVSLHEALKSKRIIFLDRFERFLAAIETEAEGAALRRMADFLSSPDRKGRLVLIIDDAGLENVLAAAPYLPQLLSATKEIHGIDVERGCRLLLDSTQAGAVRYDEEFLQRLVADTRKLTQLGGGGPDLLMALVDELRRLAKKTGEELLTRRVYEDAGGIDGLLSSYLDRRIGKVLPDDSSAQRLAKALIVEICEHDNVLGERALAEIAGRVDESYEKCATVQEKLVYESGLIAKTKNRPLQFIPSELRRVFSRLALPSEEAQKAYQIIERGHDAWVRLGSPLPKDRFEQVHRVRKELTLHQTYIEFLLHSIPRDQACVAQSRYWLRRLMDAERRELFLREWLQGREELRLRAAGLGAEFSESERTSVLEELAMGDSSEAVRSMALSSLKDIEGPERVRERLEREVRSGKVEIRARALEGLRLFHDERNRSFVLDQALNTEQSEELRGVAVETLAVLDVPGAVDDLREMALQNPDREVRERAIKALATLRSRQDFVRLFDGIRTDTRTVVDDSPHTGPWSVVGAILKSALVGLLLFLNMWLHGLLCLAAGRYVVGVGLFIIEGLAVALAAENDAAEILATVIFAITLLLGYVLPLGTLLKDRSRLRLPSRSFRSILCVILYFFDFWIFILVHGLAHLLMGRITRAAALFAAQIAALGAFAIIFYLEPMFYISAAPNLTTFIVGIYVFAGAVLFASSFILDWGVVAFRHVVAFRRIEAERRRKSLLRGVLGTPVAVETLVTWALGADDSRREWSRTALRKHANQVPYEDFVPLLDSDSTTTRDFAIESLARSKSDDLVKKLAETWDDAGSNKSYAIRRILSIRPTEASVKALRKWARARGFGDRFGYQLTRTKFRISFLPKSLMVLAMLGLPLLLLLTYHVVLANVTEANPLVTFIVRNEDAGIELRVSVANFVADKTPGHYMTPKPLFDRLGNYVRSFVRGAGSDSGSGESGLHGMDDTSRTVFDELVSVQRDTDECYVRIGLVQSLAIAVSRLQEPETSRRPGASSRDWSWTANEKRNIFGKPLTDISLQLEHENCRPDPEKEPYLYQNWTKNGNLATKKALQALNTVVREVPAALAGNSRQAQLLSGHLEKLISRLGARSPLERDALNALAGVFLLNDDIGVDWDALVHQGRQEDFASALDGTGRRLVSEQKRKPFLEIDEDHLNRRSAVGFLGLGMSVFKVYKAETDLLRKYTLKGEARRMLQQATARDETVLDARAQAAIDELSSR